MYRTFVEAVDAIDNGVGQFTVPPGGCGVGSDTILWVYEPCGGFFGAGPLRGPLGGPLGCRQAGDAWDVTCGVG